MATGSGDTCITNARHEAYLNAIDAYRRLAEHLAQHPANRLVSADALAERAVLLDIYQYAVHAVHDVLYL